MTADTEQLVRETMDLTGAAPPVAMEADSPVLDDAAVSPNGDDPYLVGLIGGKEVGKSAMVNALVGQQITTSTSHGPGTETVIAYCHARAEPWLRALLDREAKGQYRVVTHGIDRLRRQVLLDLPDIDSRFAHHVELTRRMLRHVLFPVFVQSVEKYADAMPQKLLAKVAAGNDPRNFVFCLNKADQLATAAEAAELRDDYAARIGRLLSLPAPPQVYLVSAVNPRELDLPPLSQRLAQEKPVALVAQSKQLATRQRDRTLVQWLAQQDLPGRAARLRRLEDEAAELASQRLGEPLVEGVVPRILDDPGYRLAMTDGVLAARVARWPLLSVVHTLLVPLRFVVRENAARGASMVGGIGAMVDAHLTASPQPLPTLVQTTFAQLHQAHPELSRIYADRRLWEAMPAAAAAGALRSRLTETVARQREVVDQRLAGRTGVIAPLFRWLLTVGALLWFPLVQPVLEAFLAAGSPTKTVRETALLVVQVLSATSLLRNATFLILWFLGLWLWVRWNTQRRVARLLARWKTADQPDPMLNLTTQTLAWIDDLLEEIRTGRKRLESLASRADQMRASIERGAKEAA